jgi:ATP-dependent DNA helicase RecQ
MPESDRSGAPVRDEVDGRLDRYLEAIFGPGADFHPGQREAIKAMLVPGARRLVVERTGWGKSLVYWLATRLLRDTGKGPTVVFSPLLSLMRNQIDAAAALGLRAATINSSNTEQWADVVEALQRAEVDVLLISPERLSNTTWASDVLPALGAIGMVVIDEAHCISDWGHDFRPEYRRLRRIVGALPPDVPVLATTATANARVVDDVATQLGEGDDIQRGTLVRESLSLHVIQLADQAERLAWLAQMIPSLPGSGIIYCLTVADTQRVARWLASQGIEARPYWGGLGTEERVAAEQGLLSNSIKALVATTALGMGFDKPDIGFVVHFQRPPSVIAYYQQVGRAGRAMERAEVILLTGREDDNIAEYFIESAFPPPTHLRDIVETLETHGQMKIPVLESMLNLSHGQILKALTLLEIEGAVGHDGGGYFRTPNAWTADVERMERVTALRLAELAEIQAYVDHQDCRMVFLAEALDDKTATDCGICDRESGPRHEVAIDAELLNAAVTFLRRDARVIKQRSRWPTGALAGHTGVIRPPNAEGMALSIYGDAGWGTLVRDGKYGTRRFDDALVEASAELIVDRWQPDPPPDWVTAIPSTTHPDLVRDFATALAGRLGIPFVESLVAHAGPEQKHMENSTQQLRNAANKMSVAGTVRGGRVLLVDDIVDSRWTLTYAGQLLRSAGAGDVLPFALAIRASAGDD